MGAVARFRNVNRILTAPIVAAVADRQNSPANGEQRPNLRWLPLMASSAARQQWVGGVNREYGKLPLDLSS